MIDIGLRGIGGNILRMAHRKIICKGQMAWVGLRKLGGSRVSELVPLSDLPKGIFVLGIVIHDLVLCSRTDLGMRRMRNALCQVSIDSR